ncbi:MAG TPA: NADH-quinone oxidoreductase subunit A [Candidatus Subteraquimicrobiales bacterium]
MLKALIPMLIFFVIGVGFITVTVLAARLLAPFRPSKVKASAYECGEQVFGEPWIRVHIRFYIFALLFLIFDIETVFLFPWAVFYRQLGVFGLVEMLIFIVILLLGLVYPWRKGILRWIY